MLPLLFIFVIMNSSSQAAMKNIFVSFFILVRIFKQPKESLTVKNEVYHIWPSPADNNAADDAMMAAICKSMVEIWYQGGAGCI